MMFSELFQDSWWRFDGWVVVVRRLGGGPAAAPPCAAEVPVSSCVVDFSGIFLPCVLDFSGFSMLGNLILIFVSRQAVAVRRLGGGPTAAPP
ncbi:hypothetical protein HanRHA438_Chr09g0393811 [Helianthus annuus]|nr:hypothetical protein HanIR_Chr09g0411941 [Helianthus annuus]KAJ0887695.1 hypothetical protein HanRHA438_Chr09g0393811 [Helianthus annuus]